MTQPIVADNKPVKVNLSKGEDYYFCTCGRSKSQPFCDGSHAGTSFTPKAFTAEKDGDAYLCACKHSGNVPFCDGTHKKFSAEQVGQEGPAAEASGADLPVAVATSEETNGCLYSSTSQRRLIKNGASWADDVYGGTAK